jgi:hypothetical protein
MIDKHTAIAVASDQTIDRIADNPWDEIRALFLRNDLRPLQLASKPMRNLTPCPVKDPSSQEQAQMAARFRYLLQQFGRCADQLRCREQLIDRNDLIIACSEKTDWCTKLRQIDLLPKGDKAPFSDPVFLEYPFDDLKVEYPGQIERFGIPLPKSVTQCTPSRRVEVRRILKNRLRIIEAR